MTPISSYSHGYHLGLDSINHNAPIRDLYEGWLNEYDTRPYTSCAEFQSGFLKGYHEFCIRDLTGLCWEIVNELQEIYSRHNSPSNELQRVFELAAGIEQVLIET